MVVEIEKEKEEEQGHHTLAQKASGPAWLGLTDNPSSQVRAQQRWTTQGEGIGRDGNPTPRVRRWLANKEIDASMTHGGIRSSPRSDQKTGSRPSRCSFCRRQTQGVGRSDGGSWLSSTMLKGPNG